MDDSAILVFTSRSIGQMQAEGGSQAWVLDARRARQCRFLVCAWNATGDFAEATQGHHHGDGFLVAPIDSVEPAPEEPSRYMLRFSRFTPIEVSNVWSGLRNPISYTRLSEIGIDPGTLEFQDVVLDESADEAVRLPSSVRKLSISAAKPMLAAFYQVSIDSIEIVIRG